ncbi:MAG: hypothetical protein MUC40_00695 [Akkermansiaceae bacterium]|jgi:hypothetical protein|nr:hypothetical protein [Akkermansiaceae bacterium]
MKIPLPKDPRHQRFADLLLAGKKAGDAYKLAGLKAGTVHSAHASASKLKRRPDVAAYLEAVQTAAATKAVLSIEEKRAFLARVVRTRFAVLDPRDANDENGDLIASFSESETETSRTMRVEKYNALKAIEIDNKMAGHNAAEQVEHSASGDLAALMLRIRQGRADD